MKILSTVSQAVPATKALYTAKMPVKPQVSNVANEPVQGSAPTGGAAQSLPGQIDLQAFFAAWGTNNAQFDVTKDGTVDAQDLSVLLGSVTQQQQNNSSPQDVIQSWGQPNGSGDVNGDGLVDGFDLALSLGNAQAPTEPTLAEGVQKAWGTTNTQYDLNKDGNVDATDLAMALGGNAPSATTTPVIATPTAGTPATDNAPPFTDDANTATQAASTVATKVADAVLQAKDANGDGALSSGEVADQGFVQRADLNGDRLVSREELQSRLNTVFAQAQGANGTTLDAIASKWSSALLRSDTNAVQARNAYRGNASTMANRLYSQLAERGFAQSPPTNLSKLVQGLGMNDAQRTSLMRGLAQRYPQGLGVSAKV